MHGDEISCYFPSTSRISTCCVYIHMVFKLLVSRCICYACTGIFSVKYLLGWHIALDTATATGRLLIIGAVVDVVAVSEVVMGGERPMAWIIGGRCGFCGDQIASRCGSDGNHEPQ